MKSIQLLVRDAARSLRGVVAPPWAGALLGALAADPETIAELDVALQRFQVDAPLEAWRSEWVTSDVPPDPDAWGAIVDLPARLVFWGGGPGPDSEEGVAPVLDRGDPTEVEIPYALPSAWRIVRSRDGWRERVDAARAALRDRPQLPVRRVLYDELAPWLAEALVSGRHNNADDPVSSIHAAWLATPRDDLAGRSPRDVLVEHQAWLERELQWRRAEWSRLGRQPPGLPRESRAYRDGGVGLHEFIMYYDLVRHLLSRAWEEQPGDFRDAKKLANWLRFEQSQWLLSPVHADSPDAYVPGEVIDGERQRIPLVADPRSQMIDCDCPLCQMMAEDHFGPTFIHFDTYHFDLEFVFSAYESEQEWEQDFGMYRRRAELEAEGVDDDSPDGDAPDEAEASPQRGRGARRGAEAPLLVGLPVRMNVLEMATGTPDAPLAAAFDPETLAARLAEDSPPGPWKNSRITPAPPTASRAQRLQCDLFEVAAHAMELRDDLREAPGERAAADRLLEDFANLRAAMRQEDYARVRRLTDGSVAALLEISASRRELVEKCADLETSFRRLERTICEAEAEEGRRRSPK